MRSGGLLSCFKGAGLILSVLILAGCTAAPAGDIRAVVEPLIVARTAGVETFQAEMLACAEVQSPLVIRDVLPTAVDAEAVLMLRWGEPAILPEFVFAVGEDALVAVVHPDNELALKPTAVQAIFSGQVRDWDALGGAAGEIEVWHLMVHNETAGLFESYLMEALTITPNAFLAGNVADMLAVVAENPNAIGYLPASWLTADVRAIDLGIVQPILAVSETAPTAAAGQWLACLQAAAP